MTRLEFRSSCYFGNSWVYSLIRVLFLKKGQHPLTSDSSFYTLTLLTHIDDFSMSAFPTAQAVNQTLVLQRTRQGSATYVRSVTVLPPSGLDENEAVPNINSRQHI